MIIEKLRTDEISELIKLYDELVPVKNDLEISQNKYQEIINNNDYIIFVAKKDGIVGTAMGICCKSLAFNGMNFLVVEDVVVSEKVRGMGIGRKLFEALDAFALERNCAYSILVSSGFRIGAHAFYEKMGYLDDVKGFRKAYFQILKPRSIEIPSGVSFCTEIKGGKEIQPIDKSKLFAELADTIEKFVHQESDRKILYSILNHTVAIFTENENLQQKIQFLKEDNNRLRFLEGMYFDLIKPRRKNIEILLQSFRL